MSIKSKFDPVLFKHEAVSSLLTVSLMNNEIRKIDENMKAMEARIKINELRKACGVKDVITYTVNVRKPPRYAN